MSALPPGEFKSRFDKVTAAMAAKGLDALVLLDMERPTLSGNIRYLTNFYNTLPNLPAALVVTPQEMTLCVAPGFFGSQFRLAAVQAPWLKNVLGSSSHFFKPSLAPDIATAIDGHVVRGRRVGLDGLGLVSEATARGIRGALKDFQVVEETGIVERIRIVKSPAEIALLREASRLTDIGVTAFRDALKPGVRHNTVIGAAQAAGLAAGAEDVSLYMGAGVPWIWAKFRGAEEFKPGDLVATEFNGKYEGYYGQVGRSFVIGKANDGQRRAYDTAVAAYRAMAEALKPGAIAGELFTTGDRVITSAGFASQKLRSGHGMGLTYGEGFDIDVPDRTVMQPGFYVMFHVMVAVPDAGPFAFAGNALLVAGNGAEELNRADFRLEAA